MDENVMGPRCGCPHHKVVPGLVTLFGLLFLLHAFGMFSDQFVMVAWPILVLLAGIMKMSTGMCKCCNRM